MTVRYITLDEARACVLVYPENYFFLMSSLTINYMTIMIYN